MAKSKYYKHPQYGHVYAGDMATPIGTLVWPFLSKPKDAPPPLEGQQQGAPRYEVTLILDKADSAVFEWLKTLKFTTDEAITLFNKGRSATMGECKLFGKNGDGDEADHEKYPFYKNGWILTARNAQVVKIVDRKKEIITADTIKGGMRGRLVICPLITAHGISYKLQAVQLYDDPGVRLGGSVRDSTDLLDACDDTAPAAEATGIQAAVNLL